MLSYNIFLCSLFCFTLLITHMYLLHCVFEDPVKMLCGLYSCVSRIWCSCDFWLFHRTISFWGLFKYLCFPYVFPSSDLALSVEPTPRGPLKRTRKSLDNRDQVEAVNGSRKAGSGSEDEGGKLILSVFLCLFYIWTPSQYTLTFTSSPQEGCCTMCLRLWMLVNVWMSECLSL